MNNCENLTPLLIAKFCHDLSSPLSVMGMAIESLSYDDTLISCFNDLKSRLQLMRAVLGSNKDYVSFKELSEPLLTFSKQRKIVLQLPILQEDEFPRLFLGLILIAIESMPRGGNLNISLHKIHSHGDIAKISPSTVEALLNPKTIPDSRTVLGYYLQLLALKTNTQIQIHQEQAGDFLIEVK